MKEALPFDQNGILEITREEQPWGIKIHHVFLKSESTILGSTLKIFDGDTECNPFQFDPLPNQANPKTVAVGRYWKIDSWPARFRFVLDVPHKTNPIDAVIVLEFD